MTGTSPSTIPQPSPADPAGRSAPAASRWRRVRRPAAIAAVLVLLGAAFGVGEAAAISARHSLSVVRGQLASTQDTLTRIRTQLAVVRGQLTTAQAGVRTAQAAAAQANAKAQAKYAAAEAKLTRQTKALDVLIGRVQASSISADGVYVIGQDIKPGTWHTAGDGGTGGFACYYATLSSTNTFDIIDNNNFDGPETVNVDGAHAFEISGPCTWHRTGP